MKLIITNAELRAIVEQYSWRKYRVAVTVDTPLPVLVELTEVVKKKGKSPETKRQRLNFGLVDYLRTITVSMSLVSLLKLVLEKFPHMVDKTPEKTQKKLYRYLRTYVAQGYLPNVRLDPYGSDAWFRVVPHDPAKRVTKGVGLNGGAHPKKKEVESFV